MPGEKVKSTARRFLDINKKLCQKIEPYLPQTKIDLGALYIELVTRYMNSRTNQTIVDVGGGKSCPFAQYKDPTQQTRIVAVDTSEDELKHNIDVDEKVVANIAQGFPFEAEAVDLIVSRSVLEHLESVEEFMARSATSLKKGGYFIHLLPSKFAPFALINQVLPHTVSTKVLDSFKPEMKGICGFPAFYDNCYYSAISRLLAKYDFEIIDIYISYYQSSYFSFFAPLFLASALYEMSILKLSAKNLCAYLLIVARKK